MTIGERLRQARKKAGITQSELARRAKVTPSAISQIESGLSKKPDAINLLKIARALDVTPDWLITGKDVAPAPARKPDDIGIPIYDIRAAASSFGGGAINHEDIDAQGEIIVPKLWIFERIGKPIGKLIIIRARGDSMHPTFGDGDFLLLDMPETMPEFHDGIHVFRIGDEVFVKRLQKLPHERFMAISDNEIYKPFEVACADIQIIARVIYTWKGIPL